MPMKIAGNVVLDQASFRALAFPVRIDILKALDRRQMTVTDLANALSMSKSTVHKHLERLIEAGLIKKAKDNRKWVYYRITRKGAKILHPENVKVTILLALIPLLVGLSLVVLSIAMVWLPEGASPGYVDMAALGLVIGTVLITSGYSLLMARKKVVEEDAR